ncbi:capsid [Molossus molossus circovirus 2]|uniref:capsid n=1 Tax=Molossus molossus circovirus 2 TaxID=1959843 RepID=UPI000CA2D61D|nr:capsid [Molossus molossus circovirus 2]AQR57899.1 capsid [Molossus molossus circovirus 2]
MPAKKIYNPAAYHAAVRRNAAAAKSAAVAHARKHATHFIQRGVKSADRAVKKYVSSGAMSRDLQRGARAVTRSAIMSGSGDINIHKSKLRERAYDTSGHPTVRLTETGEMTIIHREYIGELISGTQNPANFTSQNYGINPGNPGCFPWLSTVSNSFQNYKFHSLVFEYVPLTSESTATSTGALVGMGSVMMATQYDSSLGPYLNKPQMENSDFATSAKPSSAMVHVVECNSKYNVLGEYYVSSDTTVSNTNISNADIRMQNVGIFQIASVGIPTYGSVAIDLGEIWVSYSITLYKPTIYGALAAIQSSHYTNGAVSGAPTSANPFGTVTTSNQPTPATNNQLPLTFTSGSTFAFPLAITEGNYLIVYQCVSGNAVTFSFTGIVTTNCTALTCWSTPMT